MFKKLLKLFHLSSENKQKNTLKQLYYEITGKIIESNNITVQTFTNLIKDYYEDIIACMPGNVYWLDKSGAYRGCNDNVSNALGLNKRHDIIGKTYEDFTKLNADNAEQNRSFQKADLEVMETGTPKLNIEEPPVTLPDGTTSYYLTSRVPLKNKNDQTIGVVGISFDITDKKEMQEQLHQAEIKEKLQDERIMAMKRMGGSIAHELRTPLASLSAGMKVLQDIMPDFFKAYKIARQNKLDVPIVNRKWFDQLLSIIPDMKDELEAANTIINILLKNINTNEITNPQDYDTYDILKIIENSVTYFPANEDQRKAIYVNISKENNFKFNGSSILMRHVFYNLIKNALFYINENKGEHITITIKLGKKFNQVIFEDTGKGIDPEILPYIFEDMFSRTMNGTGLGLAFCKLVMEKSIGGNIKCESEKDKYTRFILSFPVL